MQNDLSRNKNIEKGVSQDVFFSLRMYSHFAACRYEVKQGSYRDLLLECIVLTYKLRGG